jgi:predicted RecB family nuclease
MLWRREQAHDDETIEGAGETVLNLRVVPLGEREQLTTEAMAHRKPLIYSGRLSADDLLGEPDPLRLDGDKYVPGDIKSGAGDEDGAPGGERKPKVSYGAQLAPYVDVLKRKGLLAGRHAFVLDIRRDRLRPHRSARQTPWNVSVALSQLHRDRDMRKPQVRLKWHLRLRLEL